MAQNCDSDKYPHINKRLHGIVAFSITKSSIGGDKGEVTYAGYNIEALAKHASFEEVLYLLWNDELPNSEQLQEITKKLHKERPLPAAVLNYINATSDGAEPMAVLRTAESM